MMNCLKCKCVCMKVAFILMVVGGINWGLIGVGAFLGYNLNLVNLIFFALPVVELSVYILVGIASVMSIVGCFCKKCKDSGDCCGTCAVEEKKEGTM